MTETPPRIGSLFSGYGGLEMGVQAALGGTTAWHVEYDKAPSKILARHWPDVPNYGDVTKVDWLSIGRVDVLTGGSPCQDLSSAGRKAGMTEGTRSNLWVAMREGIAVQRPSLVVWENVRGAYSAAADSEVEPCAGCVGDRSDHVLRALGRVLGDLSDLGYDCRWHGLRAADVGAPHGRFRVFVAATDAQAEQLPLPHRVGMVPPIPGPGVHHDVPGRPAALADTFGRYAPAIARWESVTGRVAPAPTETTSAGRERLSARFAEWMMGLPAGHVTNPAIGLTWREQHKALGNGVVPQQAAHALRLMLNN